MLENENWRIVKVCKKCGRDVSCNGYFIKHRTGTISAVIYNCEKSFNVGCVWYNKEDGIKNEKNN